MIEIRYVQLGDKKFWYGLDRHLPDNEFKKKVKSLFGIFKPLDTENEDRQIDETKKAFELKTFIHDLYKKLTGNEKDLEKDESKQ